ncbi:dopaminechrome tautomerase-like [Maniola hyperantus]|uniref:dopaminechrome tautomerase-like n=1 Tax=Aphantopus hyperantus TaxID=2795564 RepID=UPI00374920B8
MSESEASESNVCEARRVLKVMEATAISVKDPWGSKDMLLGSVFFVTFFAKCIHSYAPYYSPVTTLYRWKQVNFAFPSALHRQLAIQNGEFNQINVVPVGVERWKDRLFVTTPRWRKGIPVSLSVLPVTAQEESPLLTPFPSWDWHTADNCTGFTSVFRTSVDHCGVMWAIDTGQVDGFDTSASPPPRQLCPPTLFAISLETDTVLGRFPIPTELTLQNSYMTNVVVDTRDSDCKDLHVYIADAWRFGLIVFRAADASFWRFNHYTFYPEPLLSNYTIHGINYQWTDGLFGMALGQMNRGDRPLYYNSLSSSLSFVVSTSVIRDPSRVNNSVDEFKLLGESRGPRGQVSISAIDRSGVMFFNLVSLDSIACWNTRKAYTNNNLGIVAHNNITLIFATDLRIDHGIPQTVWIITNRIPLYLANLTDPNEFNYRLMYLEPNTAIQNTVCQN